MTYQGIVFISNEIRFVLNTARQVNLAAQNASLAARRAGNAWGFQAVVAELKGFSQGLARAMGGMAVDIHSIARGVSGDRHQRRYCEHYAIALGQLDNTDLLETALVRVGQRRARMLAALLERILGLQLQVKQSLRLCSNGRALARAARIEATYGGSFEAMLRNVALDIERTIGEIHARLRNIEARLNNERGRA